MTDWQGNAINVGDTVSIYEYKDIFGGCKFQMMYMDKEGNVLPLTEPFKTDRGFKWVHKRDVKITKPSATCALNGPEAPINLLDFALDVNQMSECICIKGVSDNQEEFMKQYLNQ